MDSNASSLVWDEELYIINTKYKLKQSPVPGYSPSISISLRDRYLNVGHGVLKYTPTMSDDAGRMLRTIYEGRAYEYVINPLITANICAHFLRFIARSEEHSFTDMRQLLNDGNTLQLSPRDNYCFLITTAFDGVPFSSIASLVERYLRPTIRENNENYKELWIIFFQIAAACYAMSLNNMVHGNLILQNIIVKKYEEHEKKNILYRFSGDSHKCSFFLENASVFVKLINFDDCSTALLTPLQNQTPRTTTSLNNDIVYVLKQFYDLNRDQESIAQTVSDIQTVLNLSSNLPITDDVWSRINCTNYEILKRIADVVIRQNGGNDQTHQNTQNKQNVFLDISTDINTNAIIGTAKVDRGDIYTCYSSMFSPTGALKQHVVQRELLTLSTNMETHLKAYQETLQQRLQRRPPETSNYDNMLNILNRHPSYQPSRPTYAVLPPT